MEFSERANKPQFKESDKRYYTYILHCADDTLYTGWTNNLTHRIQAHNAGTGAKYTKSRLPAKLVYHEMFCTKQEAMKREYQIKRLSRAQKLDLIHSHRTTQ